MNSLQHLHIYDQSPYLDDRRCNEVEKSIKPFGSLMRTLAEARDEAAVEVAEQVSG